MDRRSFLRSVLTGAAGAVALPAFARVPATDGEGLALLSDAWRRAAGRPILVILIPDVLAMSSHGTPLGAWLNHGGEAVWDVLARTEVVCATPRHVELFAGAVDWPEDPWFALLDTRVVPTRVTSFSVDIRPVLDSIVEEPTLPKDATIRERQQAWTRVLEEGQRREEAAVGEQIETLQAAVARAVAPFHVPAPTAQQVEETRQRVLVKAPPGAEWANGGGCGIDIEGEENNYMIGCGMGHVPPKSSRFLYFYARP